MLATQTHDLPAEPGVVLLVGFVALPLAMVTIAACSIRSRGLFFGGMAWAGVTAWLGASGWLADFSGTPPRIALLLGSALVACVLVARSPIGRRLVALPVAVLVGFQSFRIVVELLIHEAVAEGVAPPQFTWTGMNLDIVTGVAALALVPFATRVPRWALVAFNVVGLGLLAWIVGVAFLSIPTPFQRITPDNVWIAHFPFVWLPTILVMTALLGHVTLWRKLSAIGEDPR